jgi:hypothetical protein
LYSATPPFACSTNDSRKKIRKNSDSDFSYSLSQTPPRRTAHGASGPPSPSVVVLRVVALVLRLLRLGRAELHQEGRQEDVQAHLEELALPVLERRLAEVPGAEVLAQQRRRLAVCGLLVVVLPLTGQGLADEERREERASVTIESAWSFRKRFTSRPPGGGIVILL